MADTTRRIPLWIIGFSTRFLLWFIFRIGFIPVVIGRIEL